MCLHSSISGHWSFAAKGMFSIYLVFLFDQPSFTCGISTTINLPHLQAIKKKSLILMVPHTGVEPVAPANFAD
ncbi:hypothetical protein BJ878DRAFT_504806 [Calycina marina]|uniref:Uncharacterized protein n=1 Tax=Calycina marina TaxID=1763456 RepID=A0A9P7Z3P5_9HELO|nr:hypothetical protein BJ878DRAFT_504806 [Calycina marina]